MDTTTQLNLPIPTSIHQALKIEAVRQGVTLRELIVALLQTAIKEAK